MSGMLKEFKQFVARGNVVDLAVGIIIGAAFTGIVNSLVTDIIMPPIGRLTGGLDFSDYFISLSGSFDSLKAARRANAVTINYGVFLTHLVNFLIVSFVVFILVKQVNRFKNSEEAKDAPPTKSEALLIEIRDLLKNK